MRRRSTVGGALENVLVTVNVTVTYHTDIHLTCNLSLYYIVKVKNPKMLRTLAAHQQTVDMFPRTL